MHVRGRSGRRTTLESGASPRATIVVMRVPSPVRRASPVAMLAFVLFALVASPPALAAPDSGTVVSWLSGQRERNGIPGGLTERADWSAACAAHMSYIAQNGGILTHQEVSGQPGYSDAGNWAGPRSVLSTSSWTTAGRDPLENAPVHLAQMLAPALTTSGVSNGLGLCITTGPGYDRPAPAATTIYTYPGPGTTIYPVQNVRESPFSPQAKLGLSENGNGPTIYAFGVAASGGYSGQPKLVSASLTGPAGAVPVVSADWTNPDFGPALPPGTALIIPTTPLQSGVTYSAQVTMRAASDAQDVTRVWSFAAGATSQALPGGVLPSDPAPAPAPAPVADPGSSWAPAARPAGSATPPGTVVVAAGLSGRVRRLDPRHVRVRLRVPRTSLGHRMGVDAVASDGRVTRVASRWIRGTRPILHLHVPRDTTALLVRIPAGGVSASLRLRVPRS